MATTKKEVKPTPVKRVTKTEETKKNTTKVSETKKVEAVTPTTKKNAPVKKEEKKVEVAKSASQDKKETKKTGATKSVKRVDTSKPIVATPTKTATGKTVYHVTKRDNDGREWKVFIQGSSKVIKLFDTQAEALDYATSLCKNKDDGSYVLLHGLNGKIRKF